MKTPESNHLSEGGQFLHLHHSVSHIWESHAGDLCENRVGDEPPADAETEDHQGHHGFTADLIATLGLLAAPIPPTENGTAP